MKTRLVTAMLAMLLLVPVRATAQVREASLERQAARYVDLTNGLSLEQAIARAREEEPSLRAARAQIDVARGMRLQAGLRPNPTVSFERREEPAGTDNQTMAEIEWPLDLFRRAGRIAVAESELEATRHSVADRERLLAADVRMRYGEVLAAVRDLTILDELVDATRRQHELLRARVDEGASPPLDRDLLNVELQRLESDRLLQVGRTEAAMFELKRTLGMAPDDTLRVRDTLETVVQREPTAVGVPADVSTPLQQRPDVREADTRIAIADARIERAQREGRFDVSLFANYMRMDAGFPQLGVARDGSLERVRGLFHYVAGGAMVMVPLLNRNQGELAAARAERTGAAAAYEAAQLTAQTEIAAARARDEFAQQAVKRYSAGAQALARQNLSVVGQSYELGRVTVFDVLTEQRRYLDVERAYTDALRAAYEARTALKRALGDIQ
jgi:cobalt-zinc-cadmium efflux system outer membrane protein